MLSLALILLVVAVIAGVLGFGIANAVTHIAKFLFYVIVILIVILAFYMFFSYRSPPPSQEIITAIEMYSEAAKL